MKILKPGKVEQRKFVCPYCGCVFVASKSEINTDIDLYVCPQDGCHYYAIGWDDGEPHEEPTPTQTDRDRERLREIVKRWFIDPDTKNVDELIDKFIANGVTFREE